MLFVDQHQAARRNAEENWLAYQRGKQYRVEKQAHGGDRKSEAVKSSDQVSGKTDHLIPTAARIAAVSGVKPITIRRDADFAAAVDVLVADSAPMARLLEQPNKTAVIKVAKLPEAPPPRP